MSEQLTSFFELIADATGFDAGFTAAEKKAMAFAADFKAVSLSVSADADRMGAAIERSVAVGAMSRGQANQLIGQRLGFYGAPGGAGGAGAGAAAAAGAGGVEMGGLLAGLAVPAAVIGGFGLLVVELAKAEEGFANESAQILRNSQAIGINAQDLQAWDKIAQLAGIDQQSLVLDFERFGKNLEEGAPALKATGFTLKDLGITTTDVGHAVLQLADWMHLNGNESQKLAVATALFGRSGAELVPILSQGSAAFSKYRDELQKMGALLSNSDLFAGAQAQVAIEQFSTAFEVAKDKLLAAALPGFTMFFQALSQILVNNGQVWTTIGKVIGEVVSFILGIVAGLTGSSLDFSKAPTSGASAYEGLAGSANNAAAGMSGAADASKAATDALDDQISALQQQKRAQDEVYEDQKSALQDQLDNLRDVTDTRRRSGEDIVSYERRLEELGISDKIKGIDKAKSAYDRQIDDHINALQRERQAVARAATGMGNDLAAGMNSGMSKAIASTMSGIAQIDQHWVELGKNVGKLITDFFADPKGNGKKAAEDLGKILGDAMLQGIEQELYNQTIGKLLGSNPGGPGPRKLNIPQVPGHAAGTISTQQHLAMISEGNSIEAVIPLGDRSRALALMEQSGLASLARSSGAGSGGGPSVVVNFNGPVADELVASRVVARIDKEMRKHGFSQSRGFGTS